MFFARCLLPGVLLLGNQVRLGIVLQAATQASLGRDLLRAFLRRAQHDDFHRLAPELLGQPEMDLAILHGLNSAHGFHRLHLSLPLIQYQSSNADIGGADLPALLVLDEMLPIRQ
ncbi:hypothetical protein CCR95_15045 [Thiocystis minor]|nr:hypothetical protein [Thiocystis minor]